MIETNDLPQFEASMYAKILAEHGKIASPEEVDLAQKIIGVGAAFQKAQDAVAAILQLKDQIEGTISRGDDIRDVSGKGWNLHLPQYTIYFDAENGIIMLDPPRSGGDDFLLYNTDDPTDLRINALLGVMYGLGTGKIVPNNMTPATVSRLNQMLGVTTNYYEACIAKTPIAAELYPISGLMPKFPAGQIRQIRQAPR